MFDAKLTEVLLLQGGNESEFTTDDEVEEE